MRPTFIFDIDSTLANDTHRQHHLYETPRNWGAYFSKMKDDKPILPTCLICHALMVQPQVNILFLTGRPSQYREETVEWLYEHLVPPKHDIKLYMRNDGDYSPRKEFKTNIITALQKEYNIVGAFDDDEKCIEAIRACNIPALHVITGD